MANTAFDHASALTLPGSTTNNGLVRWGDTSAGSFGNITGITSDGSNLTLLTRGEIRFSDADSSHYIALESPATVSTSYTMALPAAVPSANDYLKVTSYSGGAGVLEWASVSADTNTTYSTSWVDSTNDAILRLTPSTGSADDLTIVAGSNITLTPSGDNLTIAATGGGSPGGSNTHVQFNNSSAFGGSADFTWDASALAIRTAGTATTGLRVEAYTTSNYPARLVLQKSNNATKGSHTTLEANEILGAIDFLASDGDSFELGARIRVDSVDNAWSASNRGSKMRFYTVPDGATGEVLALTLNEDGSINKPKSPCFGTRVTSTISNITGNHDGYVVVWDTELWDYGANLSGSTFTAPVDGIYWFEAALTLTGISSSHDEGYIRIKTTSSPWLEYINYFDPYNAGVTGTNSFTPISITCMMDLNAGQGVVVDLKISNGSKTVDINGSTNIHSRWEGMLVA